jgi:hypothetical protein
MSKNIIYKTIFLAVIAMSTCSCKKYLDEHPQNGITADNFWQTKEQLQSAVIGCYSALITNASQDLFVWGEIRADFIKPGVGISNDELNIINTTILPTNGVVKWAPMYTVINLCNTVIDYGPGVLSKDNTLTQAALNSYLGEVYALRALMYFYLVRSFGDVPFPAGKNPSKGYIKTNCCRFNNC